MVSRILAVVAMLLTSVALAAESPVKILGPEVGQRFPHTLAAVDQAGKTQSLKSLMGQKGLAVFFVRSADWCPFCKGQLVDANRHLARFRELGVSVVSISVDEVAPIAAFAQEQHIGYTMLSDPRGDINLSTRSALPPSASRNRRCTFSIVRASSVCVIKSRPTGRVPTSMLYCMRSRRPGCSLHSADPSVWQSVRTGIARNTNLPLNAVTRVRIP